MIGSQGIRVFCPTVSLLRSFHTSLNRLATLKDISIRLKSVKNIQKITQSMKMVAAAKYNRAERELRPARQYGQGSLGLLDHIKVTEELPQKSNHIIIVMTSDRGLCGAVHSNIIKMVKADLLLHKDKFIPKIVCIGEKSKIVLTRLCPEHILFTVNEIGRVPPTFSDARRITDHILNSGFAFTQGNIYYNRFRSVVSYKSTRQPVFSTPVIVNTPSFSVYDSVDDSTFESFFEYNLASMLYYAMKENACSEQSSRMTAMDSASKNAGEMIARLSLHYNRTRQAVITRELIDIVIGASAL